MTLYDQQKKFGAYPGEHGEFRRCSFVAPEFRNAPELDGWYYTGLTVGRYPVVIRALSPHWFYQRLLRQNQRTWALFPDGPSEEFIFPPDAAGLLPWEAALAQKCQYTQAEREEMKSRLQVLFLRK